MFSWAFRKQGFNSGFQLRAIDFFLTAFHVVLDGFKGCLYGFRVGVSVFRGFLLMVA